MIFDLHEHLQFFLGKYFLTPCYSVLANLLVKVRSLKARIQQNMRYNGRLAEENSGFPMKIVELGICASVPIRNACSSCKMRGLLTEQAIRQSISVWKLL